MNDMLKKRIVGSVVLVTVLVAGLLTLIHVLKKPAQSQVQQLAAKNSAAVKHLEATSPLNTENNSGSQLYSSEANANRANVNSSSQSYKNNNENLAGNDEAEATAKAQNSPLTANNNQVNSQISENSNVELSATDKKNIAPNETSHQSANVAANAPINEKNLVKSSTDEAIVNHPQATISNTQTPTHQRLHTKAKQINQNQLTSNEVAVQENNEININKNLVVDGEGVIVSNHSSASNDSMTTAHDDVVADHNAISSSEKSTDNNHANANHSVEFSQPAPHAPLPELSNKALNIRNTSENKTNAYALAWGVQLPTISNKSTASTIVAKLIKQGFVVYVNKVTSKTNNSYFQIIVGQANSKAEALRISKQLTQNTNLKGQINQFNRTHMYAAKRGKELPSSI